MQRVVATGPLTDMSSTESVRCMSFEKFVVKSFYDRQCLHEQAPAGSRRHQGFHPTIWPILDTTDKSSPDQPRHALRNVHFFQSGFGGDAFLAGCAC